jgi:hypothetical protein
MTMGASVSTVYLPPSVLNTFSIAYNARVSASLLDTGGPEQKTIVFCASDGHADAVAAEMNNLYTDWCREQGRPRREPHAFKCTASVSGNDVLPDFKGASGHHFFATTVDLLTTGVDVPWVRNVAFFRYLQSPIAFYQMVGRGTRLDHPSGKLMFRVYDFTNATRLFGQEFLTRISVAEGLGQTGKDEEGRKGAGPTGGARRGPTTVRVSGFDVLVTDAGRFILTQEGGRDVPVSVDEYRHRLAERLLPRPRRSTTSGDAGLTRPAGRICFAASPTGSNRPSWSARLPRWRSTTCSTCWPRPDTTPSPARGATGPPPS